MPWQEATLEQFIKAERGAGFRPKSGDGVATSGFGNGSVSGRVTYGEITKEEYGSEFASIAKISFVE